jgi:Fe-S-cluster-containing dehydrogenase component
MKLNRRRFIQFAGVAGPGALMALPSSAAGARAIAGEGGAGKAVLVVDVSRCRGCGACAAACTGEGRPPAPSTSGRWMVPAGGTPDLAVAGCEGCRGTSCVGACPAGALRPVGAWTVVRDASRCTGCGACVAACSSPARRSAAVAAAAAGARCDLCVGSRDGGGRCARACPRGALAISAGTAAPGLSPGSWGAGPSLGGVALLGLVALRRRREGRVEADEDGG